LITCGVVTKIFKTPTRRLLKSSNWSTLVPTKEREREKLVLQGAHLVCRTVGDGGPEQRETKARKQERQASSRIHGRT